MSHRRFRSVTICLGLLTLAVGASAQAEDEPDHDVAAGRAVVVPAGRTIDRDYFAVAERVDIAGTINGDAHVLARHVRISGTVNGDLIASGATVEIEGTVAHDARLVAGQVTVRGTIGRNLSVTSAKIDLAPSAVINGAVVAAGLTVRVDASITRNVTVAGRQVTLAGPVGGNVNAAAPDLEIASTANITGHLNYLGHHPPAIRDQAQIGGPVTRRTFPTLRLPLPEQLEESVRWIGLGMLLTSAISTLVLGLVMIGLFPGSVDRTVRQLARRPWGAGGIGLVVCVAAPLVTAALALSLIGLPLAVVLVGVSVVMLYAARIFTMTWVGQSIQAQFGSGTRPRAAFLIGLVLYYLLRLIPVLGAIVGITATLFGLGAACRTVLAREPSSPPTPAGPRLLAQDFE